MFCLVVVIVPATFLAAADEHSYFSIVSTTGRRFPARERVMRESAEAVDAVVRVLSDRFGPIQNRDGARSSALKLHATARSYRRAIRKLGAREFEDNLAMTDYERRASHVALQPANAAEFVHRFGLPLLTRRLIAHEAAHLWCDARWPRDYLAAPRWFREGIATWASEAAMRALGQIDRIEADPFLANRLILAQHATDRLSHTGMPSRSRDPFKSFDRATTYALDWAYCRWRLRAFDADQAPGDTTKSRPVSIRELLDAFENGKGGTMAEFTNWIRSARPEWEEKARSLEIHDADWYQLAFADSDSLAWNRGATTTAPYRIAGSFRFLGDDGGQANILLAGDAQGFVAVSFRTLTGVAVLQYDERSQTWKELVRDTAGSIPIGASCAFEVAVGMDHVSVSIDNRRVCSVDLPDKRLTGRWGVSVKANHAVHWRDVGIRPGR